MPLVKRNQPQGDPAPARVLVSACLLGHLVRYDGGAMPCLSPRLAEWQAAGLVVPVCPEVAGGLPVPRPPCELQGGDGSGVLAGSARVVSAAGRDLTAAFIAGALAALAAAREHNAGRAVLKEGSPSCGSRRIYDGTFSGKRIPGQGVTAALLRQNGIEVLSENDL